MASIATILQILQNVIQPWAAQQNAGRSVIASGTHDMWTQAFVATQKPGVVMAFVGDEARGSFELAAATHRGDFTFNVVLVRGRGLTSQRGDSLVTTVQNADPFYNLMESLRDKIRSITNISQEQFVDYKNTKSAVDIAESYGNRVDSYVIEFSVAQDYPQLVDTPDGTTLPQ